MVLKNYGKKVKLMKKITEINNKYKKIVIILSCMLLVFIAVIGLSQIISNDKKGSGQAASISDSDINQDTEPVQDELNNVNPSTSSDSEDEYEEETELFFYDYKDIKDDYIYNPDTITTDPSLVYNPKQSSEETDDAAPEETKGTSDTSQSGISIPSASGSAANSQKKVVIDESSETIKDETKQNEYKGEESQESIEFFEVAPSGKDVNGDVPAGGKQDVGNWN